MGDLAEFEEIPLWPYELRLRDPKYHPALLRGLDTVLRVTTRFLLLLAITCFAVLLADVFIGVIARYVFNRPLTWAVQLAQWLFVWTAFLGATYVSEQSLQYNVENFIKSLNVKAQYVSAFLVNGLILVFSAVVTVQGFWLTNVNMIQDDPTLQLPVAIQYVVVPVCFLLVFFIALRDMAEMVLKIRYRRVAP